MKGKLIMEDFNQEKYLARITYQDWTNWKENLFILIWYIEKLKSVKNNKYGQKLIHI